MVNVNRQDVFDMVDYILLLCAYHVDIKWIYSREDY